MAKKYYKPYKPYVKKEETPQPRYNPNAGMTPNVDFLNQEKHIFNLPPPVDTDEDNEDI